MSTLTITFADHGRAFAPGAAIVGEVAWELAKPAKAVEVRLFWYTQGKGTQDVQVVKSEVFADPPLSDKRPFRLVAPVAPYSFSGKLISLLWAVELVVKPGDEAERRELVIAPGGKEIVLGTAE